MVPDRCADHLLIQGQFGLIPTHQSPNTIPLSQA
jgi:hypothetical protein